MYNYKQSLQLLQVLKTRVFDQSSNLIKFRILTNIGASYLGLNKIAEAAECYIEALKYNLNESKAKANAALGYILLEKLQDAKDILSQVLSDNPAHLRAKSLIIQAVASREELEKVLDDIPSDQKENIDIAAAAGAMYATYGLSLIHI